MSAPGSSKYVPESFEVDDLFDVKPKYRGRSPDLPEVRTLKPPPEIWELVHPVAPTKRSPVMTTVNRITSDGTTLMVLIFAALALGGISAFLIVRPDKFEPKTNLKNSNVQKARPAQSGSAATTPADNNPQAVDAAVGAAVTTESPSQVTASSEPKRVRPAKKPVPASQYPVAERVSSPKSETQPAVESNTEKKNSLESNTEKKNLLESPATKPKANASASPQLVAPPKPSDSPKPKVIQWP